MTALGHLPYIVQAILAIIIGTLLFIQVFKLKPYNRIAVISTVIYSYGIAVIAYVAHLQFNEKTILLLIKWVHVVFLIGLILGIYISYNLGPEEQKEKWRKFLKEFVVLITIVAAIVSLIIFLAD